MKNLLIKEFKLTACPLTFVFICFTIMTMIPKYPILVGAFFICLGILYTFQFAREDNDIVYTALLPVAKKDVVKAKFTFVLIIELISFTLTASITLIRMIFLSKSTAYIDNPLMNANLIYLGYYLIIFSLFNLVFFIKFFKTAYYFGKPFLYFSITAFLFICAVEILHNLPGLDILNITSFDHLWLQLSIFLFSSIIFILVSFYSLKKSIYYFERIDL